MTHINSDIQSIGELKGSPMIAPAQPQKFTPASDTDQGCFCRFCREKNTLNSDRLP